MPLSKQGAVANIEKKVAHLRELERNGKFSLGNPLGDIKEIGEGYQQEFQGATIYTHDEAGTHEVHGGILNLYREEGGPTALIPNINNSKFLKLGFPISDETIFPIVSKITASVISPFPFSLFQYGGIYWIPGTGGVVLYGRIYEYLRKSTFSIPHMVEGIRTYKVAVNDYPLTLYTAMFNDGNLIISSDLLEKHHSVNDFNRQLVPIFSGVSTFGKLGNYSNTRLVSPNDTVFGTFSVALEDIDNLIPYIETPQNPIDRLGIIKPLWKEARLFLTETTGKTVVPLVVDFSKKIKSVDKIEAHDLSIDEGNFVTVLKAGFDVRSDTNDISDYNLLRFNKPFNGINDNNDDVNDDPLPPDPLPDPPPKKTFLEFETKVKEGHHLKDRTLYDLQIKLPDGKYLKKNKHAIYTKRSWENFGFFHATDIHVSKRIDTFWKTLKETGGEANKLNNFNDNFRDLIRYANFLHSQGKLDFILATGDLVDYQFEIEGERIFEKYFDGQKWNTHKLPTFDGPPSDNNFNFFDEMLLGKSPYSAKEIDEKTHEELKVPIFTTFGNHDYRKLPYELFFRIDIPFTTVEQKNFRQFSWDHKKENRFEEEDAKALQGGYKYRFYYDRDRVIDMVRPTGSGGGQKVISLDKHRIVLIGSGSDVGVVTGFWDGVWEKLGFGSEDERSFISAHPNSEGILSLDKFAKTLNEMPEDGLIIVGIHAPPFNPKGNQYPHYFRESERPLNSKKEVIELLRTLVFEPHHPNRNIGDYYFTDNFPGWFVENSKFFKKGSTDDLLDSGVSRGKIQEFLEYCVGIKGEKVKKVDLVLCGHVHKDVEFRLDWDGELLYFMDFYTDNPGYYYSCYKYGHGKVGQKIDPNITTAGPVVQVSEDWKEISIPPYPTPLNSSKNPKEWWNKHRPLLLQSAPLGPRDSFQGCRLVYVVDDTINKIHRIPIEDIRRTDYSGVIPDGGPTYKRIENGEKTFSFKEGFSLKWNEFLSPQLDNFTERYYPVRFKLNKEDFPTNLTDLKVTALAIQFITKDGKLPPMAIGLHTGTEYKTNHMTYDGKANSWSGDRRERWDTVLGQSPIGTWNLAVPNNDTVWGWFQDGIIQDIQLTISYEAKINN